MAAKNKIEQKFLRSLTFLFDMPVIAILTALIIFKKAKDVKSLAIFLLFFTLIPLTAWFYFFKKRNYKQYRRVSFITNMFSFSTGFFLLLLTQSNKIFIAISLSYFLSGFFLAVINASGYKASGHAAGIAGPGISIGIVYGLIGYLFLLLLVPAGYAKIKIEDHTVMQFVTGAATTILITFISFYLLRVI
jgi:hypothetical protein